MYCRLQRCTSQQMSVTVVVVQDEEEERGHYQGAQLQHPAQDSQTDSGHSDFLKQSGGFQTMGHKSKDSSEFQMGKGS